MTYRKFESGGKYHVSVCDGTCWITHTFLDWESQNTFCIALENGENVKEIE